MLVMSTYTGKRAEQVINGATSIVANRSLRSGIARHAIIPGNAHAWLDKRGMKLCPGNPKGRSALSITNAARAK
jgi:hypothetical protein